ncbi:NaeI family type II restriction endonuclease [Brachybacterium tyrofermentans]|uniref:NaeI family type II restriction endonuclease n=1 Tax=Brachybacterium tyrofermentans TaxID=47848 RepID=UPI003FD26023
MLEPESPHQVQNPESDAELQTVRNWFRQQTNSESLMTLAVVRSIEYVLDGPLTGRFDLDDEEVDSDERATVGTKLQYHLISVYGLDKRKPLDTHVERIPIDIKNTVRRNWMIPREAQCQICVLLRIDNPQSRFAAYIMRTHETMLRPGKNQDSKRSITAAALKTYATPIFDQEWLPLPKNPLRELAPEERADVFRVDFGFRRRAIQLFAHKPRVVFPRSVLVTLKPNITDPMRRIRESKSQMLEEHGLVLLNGRYREERSTAAAAGYELKSDDWIAIPAEDITTPDVAPPVQVEPPQAQLPNL